MPVLWSYHLESSHQSVLPLRKVLVDEIWRTLKSVSYEKHVSSMKTLMKFHYLNRHKQVQAIDPRPRHSRAAECFSTCVVPKAIACGGRRWYTPSWHCASASGRRTKDSHGFQDHTAYSLCDQELRR